MHDITFRKDIDFLVTEFYGKAMKDETIGYIFTDVMQINLPTHIPIICDFWESILLDNPIYRGNPMEKHFKINALEKLTPQHFERWLTLWLETVQQNFEGEKADLAIHRAQNIANLMMFKMGVNN
jgi:hemoglobin